MGSPERAEPAAPIRDLRPGLRLLGRFRLERFLGRGGMGVVWLARDEVLERSVALKLVAGAAANGSALDELRGETRRALALTHPNIVRVYDLVTDGTLAGISMELVPGGSLVGLRRERPDGVFAPAELLPWVGQLCGALEYAHGSVRLVHRDLKPANLMCGARGELKVADFGVSELLNELGSGVRRTGPVGGTLAYMSPQQLVGEPAVAADDLFSLGASLYDLLTGKPPFLGGNVFAQIVRTQPPSMAERRAELGIGGEPIPRCWEEVVAACLEHDPRARPRSAAEVWSRLAEPASDGVAVPRTGRRQRIWKAVRGRPVLALAVCGAVAAGGVGWGLAAGWRPAPLEGGPAAVAVASAGPTHGAPWEIPDLGMRFVPVPRTTVLFAIWETRVRDFEAFVAVTGHEATSGVFSFRRGRLGRYGASWRDPGFPQGPDHPVVGVSSADGAAFCAWLTERERRAGRLREGQAYRLPSWREWDAALDDQRFYWGPDNPPSSLVGNLPDESAARTLFVDSPRSCFVRGYDDGYAGTAPVGSFPPNRLGLYDLHGNALDMPRYGCFAPEPPASTGIRNVCVGLRVVCELGGAPWLGP